MEIVFKETLIFTKQITGLLTDDEYKELQAQLIEEPEKGPVMKGTGGCRKVRWAKDGSGKSGGIRVIYYWITEDNQIYMLFAFPKNEQENLTSEQKTALKKVVQKELQGGS
ncbi:MAG: type II toxin-antitoxin system RelE/ParE family toxin [Amphritea sp.]